MPRIQVVVKYSLDETLALATAIAGRIVDLEDRLVTLGPEGNATLRVLLESDLASLRSAYEKLRVDKAAIAGNNNEGAR